MRGILPHSCVVCGVLDLPTPTLWLCNASTLLCAHMSVWVCVCVGVGVGVGGCVGVGVGVGVYAGVCVGRWI